MNRVKNFFWNGRWVNTEKLWIANLEKQVKAEVEEAERKEKERKKEEAM